MAESGWTLGCAAQNLANELAPLDGAFAASVARTFDGWIDVITDGIHGAYDSRALARQRATAFLASLEGAKTLARAARSDAPFLAVNEWVVSELAPRPRG
jgi:TetR/AcrR family transcriptional repressor of lmrAB and yxaGH operons